MANKSPRYYSLLRAARVVRRTSRGRPSAAADVLNEMRVREYCRFFRCGLSEFGMLYDPAALRVLRKVVAYA